MQPDTDLSKLSPAALDAWLRECEQHVRKASEHGWIAGTWSNQVILGFTPLVRYVRTMKDEGDALAARVAELEDSVRHIRVYFDESLEDCDSPGTRQTLEIFQSMCNRALAGGKEAPRAD